MIVIVLLLTVLCSRYAGCTMLMFLANKLEYDGGNDDDKACVMLRIVSV